jgi:hypothetical protein
MSLGAPSPPPVPDPNVTAANQQNINRQSAVEGQAMSMVGQENPFASLSYSQSGTGPGGVPLYTATTKLNPQIQAILDQLKSGVGHQVSQGGYDTGNAAQTIGDATSGNTKALLDQGVSYLSPFYKTQTDQLDTKLRNQGLIPGQPAYDTAMRGLSTNQDLGVNNLITQFEPQAYNQAVGNYMMPLQVAAQEMGLVQPNYASNSFINPPQAKENAADLISATKNSQDALNQQYAQQVAANSNMISGMFGIPTAILGGWARGGGLGSMFGGGAGGGGGGEGR